MRFAGERMGGGFANLGTQGTVNYSEMGDKGLRGRSTERRAGIEAESTVNQYGMKSIADIRAAEAEAEATKYAGQQAGQAAMFGGLMDGISGIAGAGIKKWGGGGLPAVGTPARAKADMNTLNNMNQGQWNDMFSGWSEGLNFPT